MADFPVFIPTPRFPYIGPRASPHLILVIYRAYVVHKAGYASFKSQADREAFGKEVQAWIQKRVAKHKYLRGGKHYRQSRSAQTI